MHTLNTLPQHTSHPHTLLNTHAHPHTLNMHMHTLNTHALGMSPLQYLRNHTVIR